MKLNHINLAVADVAATRNFFVQHFGFVTMEEKGRGTLAVLRDEGGMGLTLSHFARVGESVDAEIRYPRDFHIGFILETRAEVDAVHRRLADAGISAEPPKSQHGGWAFYLRAPGDVLVEVTSYEGGR